MYCLHMERTSSAKVAADRILKHDFFMILPQLRSKLRSLSEEMRPMNDAGTPWSYEAVQALLSLAKEGTPVSVISLKLKRSVMDVRAKLSDLGVTPVAET
jgi:hypothetical protein